MTRLRCSRCGGIFFGRNTSTMGESLCGACPDDAPAPFVVTEEWIREFSTTGDTGWNKEQLRAVGVKWPPRTGWLRALIGRKIEDRARREFESKRRSPAEAGKVRAAYLSSLPSKVTTTSPEKKPAEPMACWSCAEEAPKLFEAEGEMFCAFCYSKWYEGKLKYQVQR